MSEYVVVDTSFAIKWILPEEYSAEARFLLVTWEQQDVIRTVPSWFACEVTNVLFKKVRSSALDPLDAQVGLLSLIEGTTLHDVEPLISARALDIAISLNLRATYDAQYLALAEHLDCELWTADERFWNATRAAFPRVRWIGEATG